MVHRKEVTHSNGSYERKTRERKLADEMGRAKKSHDTLIDWRTGRECFCLITIKHAISKIEWANKFGVELLFNSVKTEVQVVCCIRVPGRSDADRRDVVRKATSGRRGLWALMSWGPEKMLIRCVKKAITQKSGPWGSGWAAQANKKDTTLTVITMGSKYCSYVRSPTTSHSGTPHNPFRTLAIKWEVNILLKKSSCVIIIASVFVIVSLWCCRWHYYTIAFMREILGYPECNCVI